MCPKHHIITLQHYFLQTKETKKKKGNRERYGGQTRLQERSTPPPTNGGPLPWVGPLHGAMAPTQESEISFQRWVAG